MCLEMDTSGRRLTLLTTRFTPDQECVQWKPGRLHSSLLHNEDLLALLKLPNRDPRNVEILTLDHQLLDQLMKVQTTQNVNDRWRSEDGEAVSKSGQREAIFSIASGNWETAYVAIFRQISMNSMTNLNEWWALYMVAFFGDRPSALR